VCASSFQQSVVRAVTVTRIRHRRDRRACRSRCAGVLRGRDPEGSGPGSHSAQPDSNKSTLRRETSPVKHSRSAILPTPCRLVGPDPSLAPSDTPARPWPARDPGRKQVRAARARR